jgi:DNA-directed RNA polymerase subunit RPC12/RpoP
MTTPTGPKDDEIEVRCPQCNAKVIVSVKEADEKMKVRCPKGHEVPLVKAF